MSARDLFSLRMRVPADTVLSKPTIVGSLVLRFLPKRFRFPWIRFQLRRFTGSRIPHVGVAREQTNKTHGVEQTKVAEAAVAPVG